MKGMREFRLTDPEWNEVLVAVAIPRNEDLWGALAPLRGTAWEPHIKAVSGEVLSHALHGWATPLMRTIGVEPIVLGRRVSAEDGLCKLYKVCLGAQKGCRPGPRLPDCYDAPVSALASEAAAYVSLAWKEGRYVLVTDSPEFVIP
jgi:hypothetical protein